MFFFLSNQKLLDAYEEQNIDAYTDSVSGPFSCSKIKALKFLLRALWDTGRGTQKPAGLDYLVQKYYIG